MPAPYPLAAASRPCVHGTQVQATLRFGRPFRIRWSCVAGGNGSSSAGTCQAPQTTAIRSKPSRIALRSTVLMYASRCASRPAASSPCRSSRIASAITVNGSAPPRRDSITSSHQRSGSSYPPASASVANGSIDTDRPPAEPNCCAAGRSQNRTGTPAASPYLIACHSGLNTANGQNAARVESSTA